MVVERLSHLGLCVSDLERSRAFYRDALGFAERGGLEVAGEPAATLLGLPELELRAVYLERDGLRLELLHYAAPGALGDGAPRPMNALGMSHLSLRVADLDRAVEAVERRRFEITVPRRSPSLVVARWLRLVAPALLRRGLRRLDPVPPPEAPPGA